MEPPSYASGRLHARPFVAPEMPAPGSGLHLLTLSSGREAQLFVPEIDDPAEPLPLVLMLHGAAGIDGGAVDYAVQWGAVNTSLVLAPKSINKSWDVLHGGFGPDCAFIDFILYWTMQRFVVAPDCIAIAGFSDGASYALTLGLMNGTLFHDILALSPGFVRPLSHDGQPRISIAHGIDDPVLPVEGARDIARRLTDGGYDVKFREFAGGHTVLREVATAGMNRFGYRS
ncbi:MAG: thioesterase [Pseudomonadota bacterium]